MMEIFLIVVILISLFFNLLLAWYIRRVMKRSSLMHNVTTDMLVALEDFSTHLDHVHELPLFYGDETLKGLLVHSRELVKYIKQYRGGFIFGIEGEQIDGESEEDTAQEE